MLFCVVFPFPPLRVCSVCVCVCVRIYACVHKHPCVSVTIVRIVISDSAAVCAHVCLCRVLCVKVYGVCVENKALADNVSIVAVH